MSALDTPIAPSLMASSTMISIVLQLFRCGRAVSSADDHATNLRRAHVGPEVDAASLPGQALEVFFQRSASRRVSW